jgi:small-conductance mechanosensitive channel
MGLHLLHRSMMYIGLTLLFGIYSSFHFSLLNVGLGRFLFSIFLVLLVTRWGLDYLNYGFQGPSTLLRSFLTLHLKRFFKFFRAVVIIILLMVGLVGSGSVLVWITRDVLSIAVLIWAIILWWRIKPMLIQGSSEDTPPSNPKWIGLCQWGIYLICGGSPLLSLFGYYNLARHWTTAWIETLAFLFWGWISLNAIREWHYDHLAKVKAADSEQPSGSVDDFRWAMIQLVRLIWFMGLTAGILWAWDSSGYLVSQLGRFINATLTVGSLKLSVKGIMVAGFILYLTRLVVHIGQSLLNEKILDKKTLEPGLKDSILTIISYLAWGVGLILALGILGVNATSLAVIFGALSIGIGFGLQNIFNNFISGLILLFERPIQVGDYVEVAGLWAEVKKINVRATLVQTFDNASMIIPNSEFISQQVTNWSYKDKRMRRNIEIGVAYGSDIDLIQKTLLEIVKNNPKVLKHPRPDVLFINHADSALIFRLRIWFHVDDYWTVPSQIRCDIDRRFRELAIEIAFPQRDLHIRTLPGEMTSVASSGDSDRDSPNQKPAIKESSRTI